MSGVNGRLINASPSEAIPATSLDLERAAEEDARTQNEELGLLGEPQSMVGDISSARVLIDQDRVPSLERRLDEIILSELRNLSIPDMSEPNWENPLPENVITALPRCVVLSISESECRCVVCQVLESIVIAACLHATAARDLALMSPAHRTCWTRRAWGQWRAWCQWRASGLWGRRWMSCGFNAKWCGCPAGTSSTRSVSWDGG